MPELLHKASKTQRITYARLDKLLRSIPPPPSSSLYGADFSAVYSQQKNFVDLAAHVHDHEHARLPLLALWFGPDIFSSAALLSKVELLVERVLGSAAGSDSGPDSGSGSDGVDADLFAVWEDAYTAMVETTLPSVKKLADGKTRDISQVAFSLADTRRMACKASFDYRKMTAIIGMFTHGK